jgi:murein DD-endopeptidase MepM/ murein hydrolase activator NlpD
MQGGDMTEQIFPIGGPTTYVDEHWDGLKAVDLFAASGTPVIAVVDGTAEVANFPKGGHTVILHGTNGRDYYYAHLVQASGVAGAVRAGDVFGAVDQTGNAQTTPPHCHFAIATAAHGIDLNGAGDIAPWPILRALQQQKLQTPADELHACRDALAAERSWGSAIQANVIRPAREQLEAVRTRLMPGQAPTAAQLKTINGIIDLLRRHEK